MSPRAAARLETLGFENVYDYVAGKADWLASGLPIEGERAEDIRAGDLVRGDIPTCRLDESLPAVQARLLESDWPICAVVNADRIVLGLLRRDQFDAHPGAAIEDVMEDGPSTFRPSASLDDLASYMDRHNGDEVLVTTGRGELLGAVTRAQAREAPGR